MTTTEIAKTFSVNRGTITKRLRKLNLNVCIPNYDYPDNVVDLVAYPRIQVNTINRYNSKLHLKILELYFFNNNNEVPEIAKALNISTGVANRVINNYFKNKGLIVESKINY